MYLSCILDYSLDSKTQVTKKWGMSYGENTWNDDIMKSQKGMLSLEHWFHWRLQRH